MKHFVSVSEQQDTGKQNQILSQTAAQIEKAKK